MLKDPTLPGKMVVELIEYIQRRRTTNLHEASLKAGSAMVQCDEPKEHKERADFIKRQTTRVLNESGALLELESIDKRLLENKVKKNRLVQSPRCGKVILAWGNNFSFWGDGLVSFGVSGDDYSYIKIVVDPDTESLIIEGEAEKRLEKIEWQNKRKVLKAIVMSYLNPHVIKQSRPCIVDEQSSSHSDHDFFQELGPGGN